MNLKARLTLSFVLLAVLLAGTISCVDLAGEINQQFAATLERAETCARWLRTWWGFP